jgi:hypothetical protein
VEDRRLAKEVGRRAGGRTPSTDVVLGSVVAAGVVLLRARSLRWGATAAEVKMPLPGDELMPRVDLTATRATTIRASAEQVWPWIVQLGQGRAGFYSYDLLENLVGCDIHSADRLVPEWQHLVVGDVVSLAGEVGLDVALLEPGRSLVLRGGVPIGRTPAPYDFTWAFALRVGPGDTTRLIVRERYGYRQWWAQPVVELAEVVSFLMTEKMLRGIKQRAERPQPGRSAPGAHRAPTGGRVRAGTA